MLAIMRHRSPDDEGLKKNGIWLGMGRLAIHDLVSKGLCLIERDRMTLAFNGELFNFLELRNELIKLGLKFSTQNDSEVLLASYGQWKEKCLDKFNFMGAFAISDGQTVFLARDIAGEKPLYFRRKPFQFASEAKALNYNCVEFPPAHFGIYDINKKTIKIKRWWSPPKPGSYQGSFKKALKQIDELLADSIRLRTLADVPLGIYFSGGIDSTLLSSYHQFKHKFKYIDGNYKNEFNKNFPKILWHLDYPVKSFSAFALWKLANKASKKVKVVISGEGADELFGGYVRYIPNEFNRLARLRFPSYKNMFPYKDMMSEEFNGNLLELLRMNDRMTSAFGVENRCPFLDRRIIEFAISLPTKWKIKGFETKVLLRKLLKKRVPGYQDFEKRGLFCNVNKWIGAEKEEFGKSSYLKLQKEIMNKMYNTNL